MDDGLLCYQYKLFIVECYAVQSKARMAPGKNESVGLG